MWIFLNDAALSIVAHRERHGHLLVRARKAKDIHRVFPKAIVNETEMADYRFRAVVKRSVVAKVIANRLLDIDYTNFKNSVEDDKRHNLYMRIWSDMTAEQRKEHPRQEYFYPYEQTTLPYSVGNGKPFPDAAPLPAQAPHDLVHRASQGKRLADEFVKEDPEVEDETYHICNAEELQYAVAEFVLENPAYAKAPVETVYLAMARTNYLEDALGWAFPPGQNPLGEGARLGDLGDVPESVREQADEINAAYEKS